MTDSDELLDDLDALVDVAVKIVNEDRYEGGSHPSFGLSAKAQDILSDIIAKHKRLYALRAASKGFEHRSCPNCKGMGSWIGNVCPNCNGWGIVAP